MEIAKEIFCKAISTSQITRRESEANHPLKIAKTMVRRTKSALR